MKRTLNVKRMSDEQPTVLTFWVVSGFLLLMTIPTLVIPPSAGLDPSWQLSLGMAFARDLTFGKQYLWTYGPLGFLHLPYFYPQHILWFWAVAVRVGSQIGLEVSFLYTISRVMKIRRSSTKRYFTVMGISVLVLFCGQPGFGVDYDLILMAVMLIINRVLNETDAFDTSRGNFVLIAGVGSLLALVCMIKSSAFAIAIPLVVLFELWAVWRRQKPRGLALATYAIVSLVLWLVWEPFAALPRYLYGTAQIILGYSSAMSIPGSLLQTVVALFVLAFLCGWLVVRIVGREYDHGVIIALMMTPLVFEVWKEGFVRHDPGLVGGHAIEFFSVMIFVFFLLALFERAWKTLGLLASALVLGAFAMIGNGYYGYNVSPLMFLHNIKQTLSLVGSVSQREALQQTVDAGIRAAEPLSPTLVKAIGGHSVNVVPWDTALIAGYHLTWVPSPVLQSYSVYTPYLDQLNAKQLRNNGASRILYSYEAIDGRYPLFDEPATFSQLLFNYRFVVSSGTHSVLERDSRIVSPKGTVVSTTGFDMGTTLHFPKENIDTLLRLKLSVSKSLLGDVESLIFKPAAVYVSLDLANHSIVGPFRLVTATAKEGLFVSQYAGTLQQVDSILSRSAVHSDQVTGIKVTTDNSSDYKTVVRAQLLATANFFNQDPNSLFPQKFIRYRGRIYEVGHDNHAYRLIGYRVPENWIAKEKSMDSLHVVGTLHRESIHSGSLVQFVGNPTVYVVEGTELVGIPSLTVFNQHHFDGSKIMTEPGLFGYPRYHISRKVLMK